jgi:hypothetical protein
MQFPDPDHPEYRDPEICVELFGVSYDEILKCVESDEATEQQLYFDTLTTPVLSIRYGVPTITLNGKIPDYASGKSLLDFLCELVDNPECNKINQEWVGGVKKRLDDFS